MSAITLINSLDEAAEFRVAQNNILIARISVTGKGQAVVPTTTEYSAQAFTSMGQFSLASNVVSFNATSINLLAQMLIENGFYDFQLVEMSGTVPNAIVCENTWSSPVKFQLTRPNSPFQVVTVVDEHNSVQISTQQGYTLYAIVNGITTNSLETDDANANIVLAALNDQNGYSLSLS